MNAVFSPYAHAPTGHVRPLSDAAVQALRWGVIVTLTVGATVLLSSGRDMFDSEIAAQVASGVNAQGLLSSAAPDEADPFYQHKLDAKFEELPTQF